MRAFDHSPAALPLDKYLSGSVDGGSYRLRNVVGGLNIWTLARQAAKALDARIDASDPNYIDVRVDGLSIAPAKAVRGLRSAIRARWTSRLLNCPHDGLVARGLALDDYTTDHRPMPESCLVERRLTSRTGRNCMPPDLIASNYEAIVSRKARPILVVDAAKGGKTLSTSQTTVELGWHKPLKGTTPFKTCSLPS